MRKLIDELLKFSRTTQSNAKFTTVDLQSLFKALLVDFELIINEKNAVITHDRLPSIEGIPVQMEQLFHNMVSNALKFARPDVNPVIDIAVRDADSETLASLGLNKGIPHTHITFSDNGIGFNAAYTEQIFDIFQRLNYKQDYPGTGIGLALCRKIANNHKGKIFAEGVENEGATFHIILPLRQSEPPPSP